MPLVQHVYAIFVQEHNRVYVIPDSFYAYKQNAADQCKNMAGAVGIQTLIEPSNRPVVELERFRMIGVDWAFSIFAGWGAISLDQFESRLSRLGIRAERGYILGMLIECRYGQQTIQDNGFMLSHLQDRAAPEVFVERTSNFRCSTRDEEIQLPPLTVLEFWRRRERALD